MYALDDTIVAISSAPGSAACGIIRLSGTEALKCAGEIFEPDEADSLKNPVGGSAIPGRCLLTNPQGETDNDQQHSITCPARLYFFQGPHSYTTEDMIELHLPGSAPLLQMILESLVNFGARPGRAGEFTARAFFNGRIDLTEAEAVAAVISAQSDGELRAAERLLDGELHQRCLALSERLTEILALVEAGIDFSEEDIEFAPPAQVRKQIAAVKDDIEQLLHQSLTWNELRHLPQVALAGPANAGKSTLVNALSGIDRSIVSSIAGTTRDLLTVPLSLPQGECMLIDTAGLGQVDDQLVEKTQSLSQRAIATCDLLLWVYDLAESDLDGSALPPASLKPPAQVIAVANKLDLAPESTIKNLTKLKAPPGSSPVLPVSAQRGDNIENLKQLIAQTLHLDLPLPDKCQDMPAPPHPFSQTNQGAIALTVRQRASLCAAQKSANQTLSMLFGIEKSHQIPAELIALELRECLDNLGQISGEVITEDILGRIFSRFCIGK